MLNNRGITLLEVTIALAVFGLVIAGIWLVYGSVSFNNRVNRTEKIVLNTVTRVRDFYGDRPIQARSLLTTTNGVNLDLFAPEAILGNQPSHLLGTDSSGRLIMGLSNGICGSSLRVFYLRLMSISQQGCVQLSSRLFGNRAKAENYGIVRATTTPGGTNLIDPATLDFDLAAVRQQCQDNGNLYICFKQF